MHPNTHEDLYDLYRILKRKLLDNYLNSAKTQNDLLKFNIKCSELLKFYGIAKQYLYSIDATVLN